MKWAYGVTTVPQRAKDLLPRTLASLALAGFDRPRLFVDGGVHEQLGVEATYRIPPITAPKEFYRTGIIPTNFGNWVLGIVELYLRDPFADRYAMFEDDLVTYKNLRQYLSLCAYPEKGYWNLYTMPHNLRLCKRAGWNLSDQNGKGAVALVLSRNAVVTLLTQPYFATLPYSEKRGWKSIDGAIVTAFKKEGWQEYVHNPTLAQHTGNLLSSMRHGQHPLADSFRGEDFDALELLCETESTVP